MKRILMLVLFIFFIADLSFPQLEDRFSQLTEDNAVEYSRPLVTTLGTAMNSGGYYSADIPTMISFSISFRGMYILIPESQKNFTPTFNDIGYSATGETATIYGHKGAVYAGPIGYIVMPPGINQSGIPAGYPQISVSFLGTEVLLRYLPKITLNNENDISMLGIGLAHNLSQYIPFFPIDLAFQILYNNIEVTGIMKFNSLAFNAHASKTFGLITPYFGLQYENTSMDLSYTIKGDINNGDPALTVDKNVDVSITGSNHFRATLGASLKLAIIILNADFSLGSQPAATGGLTFAF